MPFIARSKSSGKRVNILEHQNPRESLVKDDLVCPLCSKPLIIRAGFVRIAHFAHKQECTSDYQSQPETQEHLLAKQYLAAEIKNIWKEYSSASVELEYVVEECKRVADLAMIFPSGWIVAHKIQLSAITTEELNERTKDYTDAGIDVVWWLGKSADTKDNRQWCLKNFGYRNLLEFQSLDVDPKRLFSGG
jgi:competence protein CoiA